MRCPLRHATKTLFSEKITLFYSPSDFYVWVRGTAHPFSLKSLRFLWVHEKMRLACILGKEMHLIANPFKTFDLGSML
jgi:hypothetical protein